jgi:hypothetical protein
VDEDMLGALTKAPSGEPETTIPTDGAMPDDADGELTPELRMFASELGFTEPAKMLALKNFVHACLDANEDGAYSAE